MALSSIYYVAEIEGGERIVVTNSARSLRANLRFGSDRALKYPGVKVQEPLTPFFNKEHARLLEAVIAWGRKQRNQ